MQTNGSDSRGSDVSRRGALLGAAGLASAGGAAGALSGSAQAQSAESAQPIAITIDGTTLSGRHRGVPQPKALIFCIHGGSYTSRYFDFQSQAGETLFALAPQYGYSVLAIDRPGYGAADKLSMDFDAQAALLRKAAAAALKQYAPDSAGVFLVGHSIGAMLAMLMAAGEQGTYLGLDLNGAGLAYRASSRQGLTQYVAMPSPPREPNRAARLGRMFGPSDTFAAAAAEEDFTAAPLSQPAEIKEAIGWDERVLKIAPTIKMPVNFSLSEFDALWEATPEIIARARTLFAASPLLEARVQRFAGHSVHLHKIARAYNLRTIAFADECLWARAQKR